jgi:glutaminyl-peptide cyclotransferase
MKIASARALLIIACTALVLTSCERGKQSSSAQFRVVSQTPHDPAAYTQGLLLDDTVLYESTGQYGHSDVRKVDPVSGQVLQATQLPPTRFGEGLALLGGKLYQLTWQSGIAYVYDKGTLALVDSIHYPGEGWGLATDGTNLIMSDGSDSLRIMTPGFKVLRTVHVRYKGSALSQLNELEYINGDVFANVYQSDWIVRIDPQTGNAKEILDFADLYLARAPGAEVMNGISSTGKSGELFVTGKYWPVMFRVTLTSPSNQGITR